MKVWHPWQLKKSKSWGPFWSYQLNSTANSAHFAQFLGEWAKLAVLISCLLQNGPRILIFSIVLGAKCLSYLKSIETHPRAFFKVIIFSIGSSVDHIHVACMIKYIKKCLSRGFIYFYPFQRLGQDFFHHFLEELLTVQYSFIVLYVNGKMSGRNSYVYPVTLESDRIHKYHARPSKAFPMTDKDFFFQSK